MNMVTIRDDQMKEMSSASSGQRNVVPCQTAWVGIALVDQDGEPVAGAKYKVVLPDQSVREGSLDDRGRAHFEDILSGTCTVSFPELEAGSWELC